MDPDHGQGARNAATEIAELADLTGGGVAKEMLGKDVLPGDLPFVTGAIGHLLACAQSQGLVTVWSWLPVRARLRLITDEEPSVAKLTGSARRRYVTRFELVIAVLFVPVVLSVAWASQFIQVSATVHTVAAFVHLTCVVVGFGSVLVVDWFGLRWQWGLDSLDRVLSVAGALAFPIWGALSGLIVSGMLLEPHVDSTVIKVKIGMVAAAGLVGVAALATQRQLRSNLLYRPRGIVRRTVLLAIASQICWWGATVIGFLNRT